MKTYELNDITQRRLLQMMHQVHIRIPKKTVEECIIVSLNVRSDNITDHIIDADIYHEAFADFMDEVERMMEVLDNEATLIEKVCIESEEEEKKEKVEDSSEGSDEDLYTGSRIVLQPPPTVSNTEKMCMEWTSHFVDWTKFLTEESKELNLPTTKLKDQLSQIASLYSMTNLLLWFQK